MPRAISFNHYTRQGPPFAAPRHPPLNSKPNTSELGTSFVDDGSNGSTLAFLQEWASKDKRIRLICRDGTPSGANRCRNLGLQASSGEYVIFLDSDDCLAPTCLAHRVCYMLNNPHVDFGVFGCHLFRVTPNDLPLYYNCHSGRSDLVRFLLWDNPWGTTCPMWRRRSLQRLRWDETLPSLQDWDFHVRALISSLRHEKIPTADWLLPSTCARPSVHQSTNRVTGTSRLIRASTRDALPDTS